MLPAHHLQQAFHPLLPSWWSNSSLSTRSPSQHCRLTHQCRVSQWHAQSVRSWGRPGGRPSSGSPQSPGTVPGAPSRLGAWWLHLSLGEEGNIVLEPVFTCDFTVCCCVHTLVLFPHTWRRVWEWHTRVHQPAMQVPPLMNSRYTSIANHAQVYVSYVTMLYRVWT